MTPESDLPTGGSVLQCSHGSRRVERDRDGAVSIVVDSWHGVQLNSPNDVAVTFQGII